MPWYARISRFLDAHLVYSQHAPASCGIASVMMCAFKVNKLTPGQNSIYKEQEVYKTYSAVSGTKYDGNAPSHVAQLANTLDELTPGTWQANWVGSAGVASVLADHCGYAGVGPTVRSSPVIVLVGWKGGGGHFVVVDSLRYVGGITYATICDPWDGQLRVMPIEPGSNFNYRTVDTLHWDLEGQAEHQYTSSNDNGIGNGWVVHQTW